MRAVYNIKVDTQWNVQVALDVAEDGSFVGTITSDEFGVGSITKGQKIGQVLKGVMSLEGYAATFNAATEGDVIVGSINYGWFFNKAFTGSLVASNT